MSRTDKDRPTWVRAQDPTEDRYTHHHHRAFARGDDGGPATWRIVACEIETAASSRVEWHAQRCKYYTRDHSYYWERVTHRGRERAHFRALARDAIQWHRGDPDGFMDDFDASANSPWRDYWEFC